MSASGRVGSVRHSGNCLLPSSRWRPFRAFTRGAQKSHIANDVSRSRSSKLPCLAREQTASTILSHSPGLHATSRQSILSSHSINIHLICSSVQSEKASSRYAPLYLQNDGLDVRPIGTTALQHLPQRAVCRQISIQKSHATIRFSRASPATPITSSIQGRFGSFRLFTRVPCPNLQQTTLFTAFPAHPALIVVQAAGRGAGSQREEFERSQRLGVGFVDPFRNLTKCSQVANKAALPTPVQIKPLSLRSLQFARAWPPLGFEWYNNRAQPFLGSFIS